MSRYLGVGEVTVWRWCREGSLPCAKIGRKWRVRREDLEEFFERSRRSETLVGRLRPFIEVPDNLLAIAEDRERMNRLDAAFFRIAEARGGMMVKYHREKEGQPSSDDLRAELEDRGIEVARLEGEGSLRFVLESGPPGERLETLRELIDEGSESAPSVWVNYNWEDRLNLERALEQQRALTGLVEEGRLVIKTTVLESELDQWPGSLQRRAQVFHSGTIWLSRAGLSLSRITPPPAL